MAKIKIKDFIEENLRDFLVDNGYELYHTEFIKEGKDWFLRVINTSYSDAVIPWMKTARKNYPDFRNREES